MTAPSNDSKVEPQNAPKITASVPTPEAKPNAQAYAQFLAHQEQRITATATRLAGTLGQSDEDQ